MKKWRSVPGGLGHKLHILIRKYDEYVVYGSVIASIVVQFIPDSIPWRNSLLVGLIYAGIISLIFILLDMKSTVEGNAPIASFQNMFDAKDEIFHQFEEGRKRKAREELLHIQIVGLKLRAIAGLLHEFLTEVKQNKRVLYNAKITIYYFDPKSFHLLIPPTTQADLSSDIEQQYTQYEVITAANVKELLRYNTDALVSSRNILLECIPYSNFPSMWGFGIDEEIAFVGAFTWDTQYHTFIGPQNPCVMVDVTDDVADVLLKFHYNRCELYPIWAANEQQIKQ